MQQLPEAVPAVLTAIISGGAATLIWWVGSWLAYWRRRWMLAIGFLCAGTTTLVFGLVASNEPVPPAIVTIAADIRTPVALLIVGSFIWNQPRGERPTAWRP